MPVSFMGIAQAHEENQARYFRYFFSKRSVRISDFCLLQYLFDYIIANERNSENMLIRMLCEER